MAAVTYLDLYDFIVNYFLMMYWTTGYLKLRRLRPLEIRRGDFLTCFVMATVSVLVGRLMFLVESGG